MTFAVIKTGGKQYKVTEGDIVSIEKVKNQNEKKGEMEFSEVLLVAGEEVKVGRPSVSGAKVTAEILEEGKGKKKMVFRYKSKTRYKKKKGHRQPFTKVKIIKISNQF